MLRIISKFQRLCHFYKLSTVNFLVLDVDGVLTDGGLWFDPSGHLQKRFDVRDGLGIRLLQEAGITIAFLSGREGGATEVRARKLGIKHCLIRIKNKADALENLQKQLKFSQSQTTFIGDDLNDLTVRSQVSLFIAPSDACSAVRRHADWVLVHKGGHGAVREAAEGLLKSQNRWKVLASKGWLERND